MGRLRGGSGHHGRTPDGHTFIRATDERSFPVGFSLYDAHFVERMTQGHDALVEVELD